MTFFDCCCVVVLSTAIDDDLTVDLDSILSKVFDG